MGKFNEEDFQFAVVIGKTKAGDNVILSIGDIDEFRLSGCYNFLGTLSKEIFSNSTIIKEDNDELS